MDTVQGYPEELFGGVRHIVRRVGGRIVVLVRIDAEYGKVSRMAGPHPVVGVTSEFADRGRRGAYQADITVFTVQEQEILVSVIQGFYRSPQPFSFGCHFLDKCIGIGLYDRIPLAFRHISNISVENPVRHVFHPFQKADCQPFIRQFLFAGHCPESVPKVVMLHAAVLLYLSVTAVVVGKQQSFR